MYFGHEEREPTVESRRKFPKRSQNLTLCRHKQEKKLRTIYTSFSSLVFERVSDDKTVKHIKFVIFNLWVVISLYEGDLAAGDHTILKYQRSQNCT